MAMRSEVCVLHPGVDRVQGNCVDNSIFSTHLLDREDSYDQCQLSQGRPSLECRSLPVDNDNDSYDSIESEVTAEDYDGQADDSDSFSEVGEPGSTEVVFVREGVSVCPSRNECIKGRLSLVKQHHVMFLAWLPYNHGALQEDGTFQLDAEKDLLQEACNLKDRTMYAIHPIPLSDIKAIRRHTPALGWHYIAVVLVTGLTLPPLYFNQGGVKAFLSALKQHCFLAKSADDPSTYLVNDTADPLQRSLTSLELTDILLGAPPLGASCTFAPRLGPLAHTWGGEPEPSWKGLSSFGDTLTRVTQTLRDTTSSWFAPTDDHWMAQWTPEPLPELETLQSLQSVPSEDVECLSSSPQQLYFCGGSRSMKRYRSSAEGPGGGEREAATNVGTFELVGEQIMQDSLSVARGRVRPPPLGVEEWGSFLDSEGRLVDEAGFRERVFYSGLQPELRREAWKFLLGVHKAGSTAAERAAAASRRAAEYEALKAQWQSITPQQAARFGKWRERKSRVDKDVRRTDRSQPFFSGARNANTKALRRVLLSYTMYNFDLGYCQGMSDLAAPLLYVMREEASAFDAFAALMERLEGNFHVDQRGMHAQLLALRKLLQVLDPQLYAYLDSRECLTMFFCFRWVLIHFKREFTFEEVQRLWEAIWSRHLTHHLHLYLCIAVLVHHRRAIMEGQLDFDGLLKLCCELSGRLDLDHLLRLAEALCHYAGEAGKECLAGVL